MRSNVILPVSVLLLCTSLAYWSGWRHGRDGLYVSTSEKSGKTRRTITPKQSETPNSRPVPLTREEVAAQLKAFYASGMKEDGPDGSPFPTSLMELAEKDPLAAWEILQEQGLTPDNFYLFDSVLQVMVEKDPKKAHELALTLANDTLRMEALHTVVSAWADKDPQGALAAALERPETRKSYLLSSIASIWTKQNPQAAAAYVASLPHGMARRALLGGVGGSWLGSDPAGFCDWFKGLPARDAGLVLKQFERGFEREEGKVLGLAEARLVWDTLPPGEHRLQASRQLFSMLDFSTPEKAAALLSEVSAGPIAETAGTMRLMMLQGMVQLQPETVAAAYGTANQEERREILQPLIVALLEKDRKLAETWVRSLPEGKERQEGLVQLTMGLVNHDEAAALSFFLSNPEVQQAEGAANLLGNLSYSDLEPESLLQAVSLLKADVREEAYEQIAGRMAEADPHACIEWIEKMSAGRERDTMIVGLVNSLGEDPNSSLPWALTISDGKLREEAAYRALSNWSYAGKEKMEAWLIKHPDVLSPERIDSLRREGMPVDGFSVPVSVP